EEPGFARGRRVDPVSLRPFHDGLLGLEPRIGLHCRSSDHRCRLRADAPPLRCRAVGALHECRSAFGQLTSRAIGAPPRNGAALRDLTRRRASRRERNLMSAQLLVLYPTPKDPKAFEKRYRSEHLPYAGPRLKGATRVVTKRFMAPSGGLPQFHLMSEV